MKALNECVLTRRGWADSLPLPAGPPVEQLYEAFAEGQLGKLMLGDNQICQERTGKVKFIQLATIIIGIGSGTMIDHGQAWALTID